eukprot:3885674-Pyramimonas_sp.AAC.1
MNLPTSPGAPWAASCMMRASSNLVAAPVQLEASSWRQRLTWGAPLKWRSSGSALSPEANRGAPAGTPGNFPENPGLPWGCASALTWTRGAAPAGPWRRASTWPSGRLRSWPLGLRGRASPPACGTSTGRASRPRASERFPSDPSSSWRQGRLARRPPRAVGAPPSRCPTPQPCGPSARRPALLGLLQRGAGPQLEAGLRLRPLGLGLPISAGPPQSPRLASPGVGASLPQGHGRWEPRPPGRATTPGQAPSPASCPGACGGARRP